MYAIFLMHRSQRNENMYLNFVLQTPLCPTFNMAEGRHLAPDDQRQSDICRFLVINLEHISNSGNQSLHILVLLPQQFVKTQQFLLKSAAHSGRPDQFRARFRIVIVPGPFKIPTCFCFKRRSLRQMVSASGASGTFHFRHRNVATLSLRSGAAAHC